VFKSIYILTIAIVHDRYKKNLEFDTVVSIMKLVALCVMVSLLLAPVVGVLVSESVFNNPEGNNYICEPKDEVPPESVIKSTPTFIIWPVNIYSRPSISVNWHGVDDPQGSGIKWYDVQYIKYYIGEGYHTMEFPYWGDWQMNTTNTSAQFIAELDYVYYFRVRGTDNSGNVEAWSLLYATSVVKGVPGAACEEIAKGIQEQIEETPIPEHYLDDGGIIPPIEDDDTPPVSRMEPLFPLHFWVSPRCWPMNLDEIGIQVYPYPPAYYAFEWLEEKGIISEVYDGGSIGLSWDGFEQRGGTGVESFDVQYRQPHLDHYYICYDNSDTPVVPDNSVPYISREWIDIITDTIENNTIFYPNYPGFYQFRCRAIDYAGNVEEYPITGDTSVYIIDLSTVHTC